MDDERQVFEVYKELNALIQLKAALLEHAQRFPKQLSRIEEQLMELPSLQYVRMNDKCHSFIRLMGDIPSFA